MPVVPNLVDVVQLPVYDTWTKASGDTTNPILFFTEPISATKGRNRTNLTQAQRLEAPKSFFVRAVRLFFGPNMPKADMATFIENYILRLIVGERDYQIGGLEFFPGGAGLAGAAATAETSTTIENWTNGNADPRAINVLDGEHGVPIQQGENFRVELEGTTFTLTGAAWIRIYLDGVMGRQVQ